MHVQTIFVLFSFGLVFGNTQRLQIVCFSVEFEVK